MTYIELLNKFWQEYESKIMKPNDVLLYMYLLKECNRNSWQNPFELPTKRISACLELTNKMIIDSRNRLVERGLIKVIKGERKKDLPIYTIVGVDESSSFEQNQNRTKTELKPNQNRTKNKSEESVDIKGDTAPLEDPVGTKTELKPNQNRTKTEPNNKTKTKDLEINIKEKEIYKEKEKAVQQIFEFPEKKKKQPPNPNTEFVAPTIEEVLEHFKSQDAPNRLPNWEIYARQFFDYYDSVDWYSGTGRKIVRWQGRANNWILNEEQKLLENKSNGKSSNIRQFYESDYERRQREFRQRIANKLSSPDEPPPDISDFY